MKLFIQSTNDDNDDLNLFENYIENQSSVCLKNDFYFLINSIFFIRMIK